MLIHCPDCGPREDVEFDLISSEATSAESWDIRAEVWCHRDGCAGALNLERDLRSDMVLHIAPYLLSKGSEPK